jgi:hypothetical protein
MKSRQVFFFADDADIMPIMKDFESSEAVQYYRMGLYDDPNIPAFDSIFKINNLGVVTSGDWNHIERYLILPGKEKVTIEHILLRKGGIKYSMDQVGNPSSVILRIGGVYKEGILVAGSAGTISNDEYSVRLFLTFSRFIKKQFHKIGAFYVGENAKLKLDAGWRLVTNDKSPKEYDLAYK